MKYTSNKWINHNAHALLTYSCQVRLVLVLVLCNPEIRPWRYWDRWYLSPCQSSCLRNFHFLVLYVEHLSSRYNFGYFSYGTVLGLPNRNTCSWITFHSMQNRRREQLKTSGGPKLASHEFSHAKVSYQSLSSHLRLGQKSLAVLATRLDRWWRFGRWRQEQFPE